MLVIESNKRRSRGGIRVEQFRNKRLILRSFREEDVADVYEYASDEEVVRYLTFDVVHMAILAEEYSEKMS